MRKLTLVAVILAFLSGCATGSSYMSGDYVAQMNADKRVWPPVVEGQAFPVQFMWDANGSKSIAPFFRGAATETLLMSANGNLADERQLK